MLERTYLSTAGSLVANGDGEESIAVTAEESGLGRHIDRSSVPGGCPIA
jgi:hypothetical protein